jgi:hypothetical protein
MSSRDRQRHERNLARHAEIRAGNLAEGQTVADAVGCPDCDSTVEIGERLTPRIRQAIVRHDDTCPWFAAFQARAGHHTTK